MAGIMKRKLEMRMKWAESATQCEWRGEITLEEVNKHRTIDDCWNIINGTVYDMTQYATRHPGGSSVFLNNADISTIFNRFHKNLDLGFIEKLKIGTYKPSA